MDSDKLVDWVAFVMLPGLGPLLQARALDRFGDPGEVAWRTPAEALTELPRCPRRASDDIRKARRTLRERAEREVERCARAGIRLLLRESRDYPAALAELADPPFVLYCRGHLPEGVLRVALIGSRTPTPYGQRVATGLAAGLAERGIEVVSGGARGIDSLAHRAALDVEGRTVAVLGSGLEEPYPPENRELFESIAARGAVLSEFALDEKPLPENFPRRNRLISGLAAATVVVEASPRSGSRSTANHALEQGREVLAVPGPVTSVKSQGCHALIQQGAKLVQNIEDILEELPPLFRAAAREPGSSASAQPDPESFAEDERVLYALLDDAQPLAVDDLVERAPFGIARLQAALLGLELRGAIEALPGGTYLRRRSPEDS